jgi:ACS family glucarate transporter-like MFS transporter
VKNPDDDPSALSLRPTYIRHLVLAALCAITTINYVQRNSVGGAETTIRADLNLTRNQTGDAMGAFFLTYALCQVPSGWLAQRWGGRRALTMYAAGWSLVMALTAAAINLPALLGARWAMGALQAGIFPCCTMILAAWYPATRRGFASAILNSFMLIGGVIASIVTGLLIGSLGWRWLFLLYAVPGLAWACWFAVWFRNRPQDHLRVNPAELAIISPPSPVSRSFDPDAEKKTETGERKAESIPWLAIFLSSALWLICLQQFCRAGALRFFDLWLPTYLQEARGQTREAANLWTSLPLWAGVIGGPLGGILSDCVLARTGSRRAARRGVAIGSLLLSLVFFAVAYQLADVRWSVLTAGLGVCILTFSSPCSYALTMDMGGRNLGVIFGTMNMAGNLGSWAFTKYVPRVVEVSGWDGGLLVLAGLLVVAVLCWLPLNPEGVIGEKAEPVSTSKE